MTESLKAIYQAVQDRLSGVRQTIEALAGPLPRHCPMAAMHEGSATLMSCPGSYSRIILNDGRRFPESLWRGCGEGDGRERVVLSEAPRSHFCRDINEIVRLMQFPSSLNVGSHTQHARALRSRVGEVGEHERTVTRDVRDSANESF